MKGRYSKFIVVLVIVLNVLFAAAVLFVFSRTSSEPSALVASWFAFTTGELLSLAWIKRKKIEKGGDEE